MDETDVKNAILCTTWVKRGVAAAVPDKVRFENIGFENQVSFVSLNNLLLRFSIFSDSTNVIVSRYNSAPRN